MKQARACTPQASTFIWHPIEVFAAIGIWGPDVPTLTKLRQAIVEHDEVWARVISDPTFCSVYQRSLQGDELKRAPRGFDPPPPVCGGLETKASRGCSYTFGSGSLPPGLYGTPGKHV